MGGGRADRQPVGGRKGESRYWTVTVPRIAGCASQVNVYVPGVLNVQLAAPGVPNSLAGMPKAAPTTLWLTCVFQVQVTVPPRAMVTRAGDQVFASVPTTLALIGLFAGGGVAVGGTGVAVGGTDVAVAAGGGLVG